MNLKELVEDNLVFSHWGHEYKKELDSKIISYIFILVSDCISAYTYLGFDFYIITELPNERLGIFKRLEVTSRILGEL